MAPPEDLNYIFLQFPGFFLDFIVAITVIIIICGSFLLTILERISPSFIIHERKEI